MTAAVSVHSPLDALTPYQRSIYKLHRRAKARRRSRVVARAVEITPIHLGFCAAFPPLSVQIKGKYHTGVFDRNKREVKGGGGVRCTQKKAGAFPVLWVSRLNGVREATGMSCQRLKKIPSDVLMLYSAGRVNLPKPHVPPTNQTHGTPL